VHAPDTRILFANAMAGELLGLSQAQMLGKTAIDPAWCFVDRDGAPMPLTDFPVNRVIATGQPLFNLVLGAQSPSRPGPCWLLVSGFPEWNPAGRLEQVVVNFHDITEHREAEVRVWRQANFDGLTGLPNRHRIRAQLIAALAACPPRLAAMFVDLDRFKEVNDTLGHELGDALLQEVARRMGACVPPRATIGRLGGDEFIIVLEGLTDPDGPARVAGQVLARLAEPYGLGGDLAYISASIGITVFPDDGGDVTTLLKNADQAMYAAKREGRNRFRFYTPRMQAAADQRLRLSNDLHEAVRAGQFVLHYQPIVALATGTVVKAEALVRWQHPTRGLVPPGDFIPLAEETGLIVGIGEWVFQQAAAQVQTWRDRYAPQFQVSINKSPMQFRASLDGKTPWQDQLTRIGLAGAAIVIEITESVLMENREEAMAQLQVWRRCGMQVALDDFGTGYSSLSYLRDFDLDYIKIDRSFVSNLRPDSLDYALCEAMIMMAHALGLAVVAEGVETPEQCSLLGGLGCDYGQGYLWSRPLPAADFERLLAGA
jgi:diguanylate cyclase (GGDEF)-like protein